MFFEPCSRIHIPRQAVFLGAIWAGSGLWRLASLMTGFNLEEQLERRELLKGGERLCHVYAIVIRRRDFEELNS